MAFIYRADKDQNLFHINSTEVGPGEYLDKFPKCSPRQNQEPFLSSSEKFQNQKNETPGPGTYYKDTQQLNNIKNIEKSIHNNNIDLVFARIKKDIVTLRPTEKLGFASKAKRFISNGLIKPLSDFNKTPGPGQYFPSIINKVKIKNKRFNSNKSKLARLKSNNSNDNISQDNIGLNTVVIENKNKKENNKLRKTFQYDNFACRPKLYNIRKYKEIMQGHYNNKSCNENNSLYSTNYSDNNKNITKYKKFFRVFDMTGGYNIIKDSDNTFNTFNSNINENSEGKKEIYDFYKSINSENKNAMKFRINFCKKLNQKKPEKKILDDIDKFIDGKPPGPGYYFDNISPPIKFTKLQNYFTKEKKFHHLKKPWTHLGPGEYFNIDKNNSQNKKIKKSKSNKDIPFGSNEKRNNTFLCLEHNINNPGPGKYEFQPFIKEVENDTNPPIDVQFGFTGKRFDDKYTMRDRYNTPGPGYYIKKINIISDNNKKNENQDLKYLIHPSNSNDKLNIKKEADLNNNKFLNGKYSSLEQYKFRDNVPPVGYYYPEYFSTIEYKNRITLMNSNNPNICFNKGITNSVKKSQSDINIIGPGYYIINREKKEHNKNKEMHPPFFSSEDKKSFPKKKKKYKLGLDDINKYYMNEYFKWNKKSFNVIFV